MSVSATRESNALAIAVFVNDIGHKNNFGVMPCQAIRKAVGKAIYAKVHATSKKVLHSAVNSPYKLAFLTQRTLLAERVSGAAHKRSEIKHGPVYRQATLAAHQVKSKRVQGSVTNA